MNIGIFRKETEVSVAAEPIEDIFEDSDDESEDEEEEEEEMKERYTGLLVNYGFVNSQRVYWL